MVDRLGRTHLSFWVLQQDSSKLDKWVRFVWWIKKDVTFMNTRLRTRDPDRVQGKINQKVKNLRSIAFIFFYQSCCHSFMSKFICGQSYHSFILLLFLLFYLFCFLLCIVVRTFNIHSKCLFFHKLLFSKQKGIRNYSLAGATTTMSITIIL